MRQQNRRVVVDLLRLDDHSDLAARLQRVHLLHPRPRRRQFLERLEPLDVVLERLAAGAGTRRRDRVRRDQQHRLDRLRLHLVVMRLDRMHDALRLAVAARELCRDQRMRAFDLVRHRLADVVQHRGALRRLHARAELRGHDPAEVHDLERVLEHVLPVARPVAQPPEHLDELLVEVTAVRLEHGLRAGLMDVVLQLRLRLVVHLLDLGRVDAPVLDQLHERQLRGLSPDAVERREDDSLRRVVDDEVDTGEVLQRPDVAALAADDPPLHVVGRQLDERHRRLCRV